jgi:hypothetical protein
MTSQELHERIYRRGLIEKWSQFVIEKWQKQIEKLDVIHTRELARSFSKTANQDKVQFRFLKYGVFRDMGAGKGYRKGARISKLKDEANAIKGRQAKMWKSKVLYSQVARLAELIARENGRDTANYLVSELNIPLVIES